MFDFTKSWLSKPSGGAAVEPDEAAARLAARIRSLNSVKKVMPPMPERKAELRAAERFLPRLTSTQLTAKDGKTIDARIIDVSTLSVAVDADFSQVPIDEIVLVGSKRVEPGRKLINGVVFMFERPLDPKSCGIELVL